MQHLGTTAIETSRLLLRRFEVSDAEAMFANWASDSEVTKYLMWPTHPDVNATVSTLSEWAPQYEKPDFYLWAITLKDTHEPIGSISVVEHDDAVEMAHIGYCIGQKWWRQGIVSEALAGVMKFLFEEVGINRIEARHDPRNPNSGKVMMHCGMQYEGTHRQNDHNNQGRCDSAHYAILACEYRKRHQNSES